MDETMKKVIKTVAGIMLIAIAGGVWIGIWTVGLALAYYSYEINNKAIGSFLGLLLFSAIVWCVYEPGRRMMGSGRWQKCFLIIFWLAVIAIVCINVFPL